MEGNSLPQFEFIRSGAMKVAFVDGRPLNFNGNTAVRTLASGEYSVQWFARGNDTQAFGLTAGRTGQPPIREVKGKLGPSRKDSGMFWLEV
jgi:hypothetical protein